MRVIFSYFSRTGDELADQIVLRTVDEKDAIYTEERARRATVCNARLVCRLFSELASPLLLPALNISLDCPPLDLAEAVSRNRLVASGVRVVNVVLRYRPDKPAASLKAFTRFAGHRPGRVRYQCYHSVAQQDDRYKEGLMPDEQGKVLTDVIAHIMRAWDHEDGNILSVRTFPAAKSTAVFSRPLISSTALARKSMPGS